METKKCTTMIGTAAVLLLLAGGSSPALAASGETTPSREQSLVVSPVRTGIGINIQNLEAARSSILAIAAEIRGTARPTDHTVQLINDAAQEMQQIGGSMGGSSASALLRAEQDMRSAFARGDATEGYNVMIRVANALQATINSYVQGDQNVGVKWP